MNSEITRSQETEFRSLVRKLNQFIAKVRESTPEAEFYLDGSGYLNLMNGPHHDGRNATARPENIQCRERLDHSDGGDW